MSTPTKDENVKSDLEIETNDHIAETENDVDELVHENGEELPDESKEQDADDLVHEQKIVVDIDETKEGDPDDLVHGR